MRRTTIITPRHLSERVYEDLMRKAQRNRDAANFSVFTGMFLIVGVIGLRAAGWIGLTSAPGLLMLLGVIMVALGGGLAREDYVDYRVLIRGE